MKQDSIHAKVLIASLLVICLASIPISTANADLGPKPTMSFEFIFADDLQNLLVLDGILLECEDAACIVSEPLEEIGPQGFSCYGTTCHAIAYGFSDYHKLVLSFSDGITRESNIFTKTAFEANFIVTVEKTSLLVEEGRGYPNPNILFILLVVLTIFLLSGAILLLIIISLKGIDTPHWRGAAIAISGILFIAGIFMHPALPITIIIELLIALIYVFQRKRQLFSTLSLLALANVITQFALWASLTAFSEGNNLFLTLCLEIAIWMVETIIFYFPQKRNISFSEAALLSLVLNLSSFTIGLFLPI